MKSGITTWEAGLARDRGGIDGYVVSSRDSPRRRTNYRSSEAQLYFELNHTDGDLGIHGLIDGDAWKSLEIEGPGEQLLMNVWIRGSLRKQGMTEFFFESDEPSFDELTPAAFLQAIPAGYLRNRGHYARRRRSGSQAPVVARDGGAARWHQGQRQECSRELRCDAAGCQRAGDVGLERP